MSLATLALISAVAVLGPLLALPRGLHLPVVFGELVVGALLGSTGIGLLHPQDPTFSFLADLGFALVMFVAGTQVPIRDRTLRASLPAGALRAGGVGLLAVPAGLLVAWASGTGHPALYAVLAASSSAALVLPTVASLSLHGPAVLQLLAQVAVADVVCIVALPLVIDPHNAGRSALGAAAIAGASIALFLLLRALDRSGTRRRVEQVSQQRQFAVELRVNLAILFALAALATATHTSIMLAGFCFGLAVAAVGEPRRLAGQLFALTEGFLGPLFFVWLGASLDVAALADDPSLAVLGAALAAAALGVHASMTATGQPLPLAGLAAAQLGLPVAAATIGTQRHLLAPGEPAALMLAALLTVAVAVGSAALAARTQPPGGIGS